MSFCKAVFWIFIAVWVIFAGKLVFGYGSTTTHPGLTDEIVDFYNLSFENQLTQEEKEWIIQGSIDEDTPPRWINHFYDPIYKQGWTGEETGWLPQELMRVFSFAFLSTKKPVSSKDWASNQLLQSSFGDYKGNRTWQRAIYEYAIGNKKEAFYSLGFVLHLIEDLTVPDHTRNDTHAHDLEVITGDYGSPYEEYTKKHTRENLTVANDLQKQNAKPVELGSLDAYFDALANYSNNYFFSKDTIDDGKYNKPIITKTNSEFGYGVDLDGKEFPLVKSNIIFVKKGNILEQITVYDLDNKPLYYPILDAYFSRLSQQAVLNGAGMINLFFKEAELAKKNLQLAKPPKESAGIFSLFGTLSAGFDKFISLFEGGESQLASTPVSTPASVQEPAEQKVQEPAGEENNFPEIVKPEAESASEPEAGAVSPIEASQQAQTNQRISENESAASEVSASNYGSPSLAAESRQARSVVSSNSSASSGARISNEGSAGIAEASLPLGSEASKSVGVSPEQASSKASTTPLDLTPPDPPIIVSPANFQTSTTSSVAFSGTAEANSTISQNFSQATTTVDSGGNWVLVLDLIQGTSTLNFYASDSAGNVSSSTDIEIFVDSVAPVIDNFYIAECRTDNLLSDNDDCLLATTTVNLLWSSDDDNLDYYELSYGPNISTTAATSVVLSLSDNVSYIFSLRARDKLGNWVLGSMAEAEISTMPVIINEVAWMGTASSTFDEWIELYNRTSKTISLENWVLSAKDQTPFIALSGSIGPKSYFLLERNDNDNVSDIPANLIYGNNGSKWALNNEGEVLILSYASTTIDEVPYCSSSDWCAGSNVTKGTMERHDGNQPGADPLNWATNNGLARNGKDAGGNLLNATPKARNSADYLITPAGRGLFSDKTLVKEKSPYLVYDQLTKIYKGVTLTIEPGVVIKFYSSSTYSGLDIEGVIKAQGTDDNKIIFTSYFDDQYGGDFNGDADSTLPSAGNWHGVHLFASSAGSVFANVVFRYGGGYSIAGHERANLSIKDVAVDISNSIFENSAFYGLRLTVSDSQIAKNTFQNNEFGLYSQASDPVISDNHFSNNQYGLLLDGGKGTVSGNVFDFNREYAIGEFGAGDFGNFSNNSGQGNKLNGIVLAGAITKANATSTLKKTNENFPYILERPVHVAASSALVLEPGVVIKGMPGTSLNIWGGRLIAQGQAPSDIVFTSIYDDTLEGDTDNSATTSPKAGDWYRIHGLNNAYIDLKGVTIRYGGKSSLIASESAFKLENSIGNFENVLFEDNYDYVLYLRDATTTIKNSEFKNNTAGLGRAISYFKSPIDLQNVKFSNNNLGVEADANAIIKKSEVIWENNIVNTSPPDLF